jgi:hypothetical protein
MLKYVFSAGDDKYHCGGVCKTGGTQANGRQIESRQVPCAMLLHRGNLLWLTYWPFSSPAPDSGGSFVTRTTFVQSREMAKRLLSDLLADFAF